MQSIRSVGSVLLLSLPLCGVAVGRTHSGVASIYSGTFANSACAILADGAVQCWGDHVDPLRVPTFVGNVTSISLSNSFGCVVSNHNALCWGDNTSGQLGDSTFSSRQTLAPVMSGGHALDNIVSVSVGADFACANRGDGTVWCWGNNWAGQLGNYLIPATKWNSPVMVIFNDSGNPALSNVRSIALGNGYGCAHKTVGYALCWGYNDDGELGNSKTAWETAPVGAGSFQILETASLHSGNGHVCGILSSSSKVSCWGLNTWGQLGNASGMTRMDGSRFNPTPSTVLNADTSEFLASSISLGARFGCATVNDSQAVRCWGLNDHWQLGHHAEHASSSPVPIDNDGGSTLNGVIELAAGYAHACALLSDNTVRCWGANELDQVGVHPRSSWDVATKATVIDAPIFTDNFEPDPAA
jgi:alpha-tubulin suppressor-like RCC1 family protein